MGQAYSDKLGLMGPLPFVQGIVCVRISPGSGSEGADADMWCLVALPPMARAGRRRPSTSVPRRGRTLAALPCGCRPHPSPHPSLPGRAAHRPRGALLLVYFCCRYGCSLTSFGLLGWAGDARASAPVEAGLVRGVLCHGHGPGNEVIRSRGMEFCL